MQRSGTALLVVFLASSALEAQPANAVSGLVVERVEPGGAAAKVGIQAGDILLSWQRAANPPANPESAAGRFRGPFDLRQLEAEQAPRGAVTLLFERAGGTHSVELAPGTWLLTARPFLAREELARYRQAAERIEAGDVDSGIGLLRELVSSARQRGGLLGAAWWSARAAELAGEAGRGDHEARICAEAIEVAEDIEARTWVVAAAAESLARRGMHEEAARRHREVLRLRLASCGPSLAAALSLHDLGGMAEDRGDLATAAALYRHAAALLQRLAPASLDLGRSLAQLGIVARERGHLDAAEGLAQRALALQERLAPDSLDVAWSLGSLGTVALRRGALDAAEGSFRSAFAITERLAPGSHDLWRRDGTRRPSMSWSGPGHGASWRCSRNGTCSSTSTCPRSSSTSDGWPTPPTTRSRPSSRGPRP